MLNRSTSFAMSTSILKACPGKLDIKRHSPSILYISISNLQQTTRNVTLCSVCFQGQEGANTIVQDIDKILRKATSQLCEQINETQPLNIHSDNLGILAEKLLVTL